MIVRAGRPDDLASVVALERSTVEAPHWSEQEYADILDEQSGGVQRCLFVAEHEGKLMGFAVTKGIATERTAELESVAVEPESRRCGVGRTLCQAAVAWSLEQGARSIELEVRAGGAGAIALYTGLGFIVEGQRRAYYEGPVEDALLMRLVLTEG